MTGQASRSRLLLAFLLLAAADIGFLAPALFDASRVRAPGDEIMAAMPYRRESGFEEAGPRNPYLGDWSYSIHSWQMLVGEALRAGRLPLWNERAGCGQPLVGNMQAELFSPYQPLNVLAGDQYVDWKQLAQLLVAQLACLLLASVLGLSAPAAFLLAVGYSFGSYMQTWMVHPVAGSAAFAPAILAGFLLLRRGFSYRRLALTATMIGLGTLAGHVETIFMACFAGSALGFLGGREGETGRARIGNRLAFAGLAVGAGALGLALAAPSLLPFFDYYDQSLVASLRLAQPARSVPPTHLLALLDAKVLGFPGEGEGFRGFENYITTILHPGRVVLLLAAIALPLGLARRRRGVGPLVLVAAAGVALSVLPPAAQDALDFFPFNVMPLLRSHYLAALLLPALAGIGLDEVLRRGRGAALLVVALGLMLAALGPTLLALRPDLPFAPRLDALGLAVLAVAALLLAAANLLRARRAATTALAALLVLALAEAVLLWRPFIPVAETATLRPRTATLDYLEARPRSGRLLPVVPVLPPELGNLHAIQSLRHYDGMGMTRLTGLMLHMRAYQGVATDAPIVRLGRGQLDALGIRWTLTDFDPERAVGLYLENFVGPGHSGSWDFESLAGAEIEFLVFSPDGRELPAGAFRLEVEKAGGPSIAHDLGEPDGALQQDPAIGFFHRDRDTALTAYIAREERGRGGEHHHVAFRMSTSGDRLSIRTKTAAEAPEMVIQVLARDALGARTVFEHEGVFVGERADALPLLHVAPAWRRVGSLEDAVLAAGSRDFDPRTTTLLECAEDFVRDLEPEGAVRPLAFERPRPEIVRFRTDFERETIVVFAEVPARGWEARSESRLLPLAPANLCAMALRVPAGPREVELRYRSRSLAWGLLVGSLALLLLVASPLADRLRRKKSGDRSDADRSIGPESSDDP